MEYSIKPEEHELREARQIVEEVLETCNAVMPKEDDLEVGLAWTTEQFILEEMGGTGAEETMSSGEMVLKFNSGVNNWRENLRRTVAHEYAHTVFWEDAEDLVFEWQWVLFEAHGQLFAEKISPDTEAPWSERFSDQEIVEMWPEIKQKLSEESDWGSFWYGSEEWPQWLGYTLSYKIGQKLLEDYDLEDFPKLKRSDVIEAGDELFS